MVDSEKRLRKTTKSPVNHNIIRNTFKEKQSIFDNALHNAELSYNCHFADETEEINSADPNTFWNYIQDRRWNADKPSAALDPYIPT